MLYVKYHSILCYPIVCHTVIAPFTPGGDLTTPPCTLFRLHPESSRVALYPLHHTAILQNLLQLILARWFFPSSSMAHLCLLNIIWHIVSSSKQEVWIARDGRWACKPAETRLHCPYLPVCPPPHRHCNTDPGITVLRKESNRLRKSFGNWTW